MINAFDKWELAPGNRTRSVRTNEIAQTPLEVSIEGERIFRCGGRGGSPLVPREDQNKSFNANWIWREVVDVVVMTPAEEL